MTQFDLWVKDILATHNIPDLDSYRHTIAAMVLQLGNKTAKQSKYYFVTAVRKAQANQVAHEIMQEINKRLKQQSNQNSIVDDAR